MSAPSPTPLRQPAALLTLVIAGIWCTTAGHLLTVWLRQIVLGRAELNWIVPGHLFLTLGGYTVVFLVLFFVLLPLHLLLPRHLPLNRVAGVVAGVAAFGTLLVITTVSPYAWLVLSIGIGVRVSAGTRPTLRLPHAVRMGAASLAIAGLLVTGHFGTEAWREHRWLGRLPPAASGAPNVLLLVLDTVRAQSLGLYGSAWPTTPRLGAWARRGMVFREAFSTAPWTLPSHASMFTGHYASQQSADWLDPLDDSPRVIAEWFMAQGYATGGFVGNLLATGHQSGLDRGYARYMAIERNLGEVMLTSTFAQSESVIGAWRALQAGDGIRAALKSVLRFDWRRRSSYNVHIRKDADRVLEQFTDWAGRVGSRPYFAFINLFDAHHPYASPAPFETSFGNGAKAIDRYHGAIRYLDDRVANVLDRLERSGSLNNTIVVITSDHGELFGEHGLQGHGHSLYRPLLHVPLIIIAPGRAPAGAVIAGPVSLRDLSHTLQHLVLGTPPADPFPGVSLMNLLSESAGSRSLAISEVSRGVNENPRHPASGGDMIAIVDDSLHAISGPGDKVEAFRYRRDPGETDNLARTPFGLREAALLLDLARDRVGRAPRR